MHHVIMIIIMIIIMMTIMMIMIMMIMMMIMIIIIITYIYIYMWNFVDACVCVTCIQLYTYIILSSYKNKLHQLDGIVSMAPREARELEDATRTGWILKGSCQALPSELQNFTTETVFFQVLESRVNPYFRLHGYNKCIRLHKIASARDSKGNWIQSTHWDLTELHCKGPRSLRRHFWALAPAHRNQTTAEWLRQMLVAFFQICFCERSDFIDMTWYD